LRNFRKGGDKKEDIQKSSNSGVSASLQKGYLREVL
jgi:hypothetical protein